MLSVLLACSGGKSTNPSNPEIAGATQVLSAGTVTTLGEDSGVLVPAGTVVTEPDGRKIKIKRSNDKVYVRVGSKIAVPLSATGTPRIVVMAAYADPDNPPVATPPSPDSEQEPEGM